MDLSQQQAHPNDADREAVKAECFALRCRGFSYREIAREAKWANGDPVHHATVHVLVVEALEELREENAEAAADLRKFELARLDKLLAELWPKSVKKTGHGNDNAQPEPIDARRADSILRVMERRHKLLGIDAPIRWEGSGPGGGPLAIAAGVMDLAKLTLDELKLMESLLQKANAPAQIPAGATEPTPTKAEP